MALENRLGCVEAKVKEVVGMTTVSYLLGLTTGAIGKSIGGDSQYIVPAVLPGMDLIAGRISPYIIPYFFGVATNYISPIYAASQNPF